MASDRVHRVLGVNITDVTMRRAIALVEGMIRKPTARANGLLCQRAYAESRRGRSNVSKGTQ